MGPVKTVSRRSKFLNLFMLVALALWCSRHEGSHAAWASELYNMPDGVQTRWFSPENWTGAKGLAATTRGGRKGSPSFSLGAGERKVLAEVKRQRGAVRRIWFTVGQRTPEMLRGMKIEMFWDDASQPAVSVPFGDFFCQGLGRTAIFENALFASPEGRSYLCTVPMPFRNGMKIVLANDTLKTQTSIYYDIDVTLGDAHGADMLYFHAIWRRERPTILQRDFEVLPRVTGRGRFLGACFSVIPDTRRYFGSWWGEGEVKVYLDGDRSLPTLAGTGTEDYISDGWSQGQFSNQSVGCTVADEKTFRYAFYRLHLADPVWFQQDCRVTIQQIGYLNEENGRLFASTGFTYYIQGARGLVAIPRAKLGAPGYNLFERQDDWAACAWFYLNRPTNGLPSLAPAAQRTAGL